MIWLLIYLALGLILAFWGYSRWHAEGYRGFSLNLSAALVVVAWPIPLAIRLYYYFRS